MLNCRTSVALSSFIAAPYVGFGTQFEYNNYVITFSVVSILVVSGANCMLQTDAHSFYLKFPDLKWL